MALDDEKLLDGVGKRASRALRAEAHGAQHGLSHIHYLGQGLWGKLVGRHHAVLRGVIQHSTIRGHAYRPDGKLVQHGRYPPERSAGGKRKVGTLLDRPRHGVTVATRDAMIAVQQGAINIARNEARRAG